MAFDLKEPKLIREEAYLAGKWLSGGGRPQLDVFNPADGSRLGSVPVCSVEDAKIAIDAAHRAQGGWRATTAKERSNILRAWFNLVIQHREDLAQIITLEQGKPLAEARAEVTYSGAYIEWFAEEAKRAYGDIIPGNRKETRLLVVKEPVGVVATITPWNFPSAMLARKIAPALAAGCAVVSKPAELTPFSALALAYLGEQAGLPPGIWSVLNGDPQSIGLELTTNPTVRKVTFTGSTRTGKILMEQCSSTVKKLSMELGGNAPFIVFESADIDAAVTGAMFAKFRNNGQTCICVNRFFVHAKVYDQFRDKLVTAVRALKIGAGLSEGTDVGPLINKAAVEKVESHINDAATRGAKIVCGGKQPVVGRLFFEPTVIDGATPEMLVAREETFGPLASLFKFSTESEALTLANRSEFGLAGYFYSRDLGQIWRAAEALEVGMVGVNDVMISAENIPFGGVKQSGFGREGSKYGLDDYTHTKYICLGGIA
ncbi:MAG: NADP-dependent succinate-semialdehyde dehydrogenase [Pseudomonadota bacterium]